MDRDLRRLDTFRRQSTLIEANLFRPAPELLVVCDPLLWLNDARRCPDDDDPIILLVSPRPSQQNNRNSLARSRIDPDEASTICGGSLQRDARPPQNVADLFCVHDWWIFAAS
ncbi:hypothetical protein GS625_20155 [Ruegeria sp. HKCCD7319]|nr:hypothetical protein [Ruegeria sp. HKCCD7319]